MIYKLFKNVISPNLKSKLRQQLHEHKSANHRYHRDILCQIFSNPRPRISAYMLTTDAQGDEDGTIVRSFFELNVSSVENGFNQLTIEVQKTISKYPQFEYFHLLRLFEDDAHYYLNNREKLSLAEKSDMIGRGEETKSKTIHIYEKFSDGSWHISDRKPYVYDGDIEYGWIQP